MASIPNIVISTEGLIRSHLFHLTLYISGEDTVNRTHSQTPTPASSAQTRTGIMPGPQNSTPDPALDGVSAIQACQEVATHYLATEKTSKQNRTDAFNSIPRESRHAIGTFALQLNLHGIDWRKFGSIREMSTAEQALQERLAAAEIDAAADMAEEDTDLDIN